MNTRSWCPVKSGLNGIKKPSACKYSILVVYGVGAIVLVRSSFIGMLVILVHSKETLLYIVHRWGSSGISIVIGGSFCNFLYLEEDDPPHVKTQINKHLGPTKTQVYLKKHHSEKKKF